MDNQPTNPTPTPTPAPESTPAAEPVDGVENTDNSTETKVDLTYEAVREEIEDETTLEQFVSHDGKTAEELKEEAESSSDSEPGVALKCTIEE